MDKILFMGQMEENTRYSLVFPFHIDHSKLLGRQFFSESEISFHQHTFEDVLKDAFMEPNAFYLTDEDKEFYSKQELTFIEKVIACEKAKIEKGYEMMSFELEEETINYINIYKEQNNCTFEEAVNKILKEMIDFYSHENKN